MTKNEWAQEQHSILPSVPMETWDALWVQYEFDEHALGQRSQWYAQEPHEQIATLKSQNERLVRALEWMVQLCDEHANRGAFSNGVTDPTGIDEGEVVALNIIKEAKAVLAEVGE